MRKPVIALVFAMLTALGAFAPTASAAVSGDAKVVIIVGATHGATAGYRAAADQAYAEAIKYSSDVVKVYSPNATWAKVKAATTGASIVVYFGHGNGWPSPYTYDPAFTTKDGFGLNAVAGAGDYNNKYYGEPSVATLDLAPNAVVILSRLCYASGNSEPGNADPSQSVARQRVDNFAAGFLKAAQAVIADGHGSPGPYIRALFTTHATIQEVWGSAPNAHGHVKAFSSTRTPGAIDYTDTDDVSSGYYRSLVARPGLTSDDVTGATYADTGVDPASLQVPGNAIAGEAGAGLYTDAALTPDPGSGQAPASLPAGARLRVVANGYETTSIGTTAVEVEGVDDTSIHGWVSTLDLLPKDSTAPRVWGLDDAGGSFSPNGDGRSETGTVTGRFSESVAWTARFFDGVTTLATSSGTGTTFSLGWDGTSGGTVLPDGAYEYEITAQDAWDNGPTTKTGHLTIDTVPAQLSAVTPGSDVEPWISPDGDGSRESLAWTATMPELGSLVTGVYDATNHRVRAMTDSTSAGANAVAWDGKDDHGAVVPDGLYDVRITPRDAVGNSGTTVVRPVRVDTTLGFVTSSKALFYPQDGDTLAPRTTLAYTLTRPATVTWVIKNAAGTVVDTLLDAVPTAPGHWTQLFDGTLPDATRLPAGAYSSVVSATHDSATATQAAAFTMQAFAIRSSDTTPARGQTITIYATSAEPLSTTPRLYVFQPGHPTWSVAMKKISTYGYRVTIKLKTGGAAGPVKFVVVARDSLGTKQRTTLAVTSH